MSKRKLWIIELFVWILLIFSITFVCVFIHNKNIKDKYTYNVFFKDVDGLIKGSPVKIQGVQVGYISNIKVINDEVFITFIITDKDFKMPSKMVASVAFTGMGGSKSLELFVPEPNSKSKNYISTVEPMRLQDFYYYSSQTAQNIVTMTTDFMKMFDDRTTQIVTNFIRKPQMLDDAHKILDEVQKGETDYMNKRRNNDRKNK